MFRKKANDFKQIIEKQNQAKNLNTLFSKQGIKVAKIQEQGRDWNGKTNWREEGKGV